MNNRNLLQTCTLLFFGLYSIAAVFNFADIVPMRDVNRIAKHGFEIL
jgi:hypothetical protein